MERLADYFVVLQLGDAQNRHNGSAGVIKQKIPENDWPDAPFAQSLPTFCMPQGWDIRTDPCDPVYYVGTLTDMMGSHQYACCLQFFERCTNGDAYSEEEDPISCAVVYKPKVFVILTRCSFFEFFRVFLCRLRTALTEEGSVAESMVSSLFTNHIHEKLALTLFVGQERFTLRSPHHVTVPMTDSAVHGLVKHLGSLHNLIVVFRSILSDQKLILHSTSMKRLTCASYAIKAMIFPLEYTYTFVPVLPEQLIEYLESPTPYLMGIFSSVIDKVPPVDAVIVDLDIGEIRVPSSAQVPELPSPFKERLLHRLQSVLSPELRSADLAEPPALPPMADAFTLDKRIRSCFLLFMAEVLYGYRSCLQLVRLHSSPLIVFHKAAFMGLRRLNSPLIHHLLEGQMFQLFVSMRGIPYRECDIFDEIVCKDPKLSLPVDGFKGTDNFMKLCAFLGENERQEPLPVIPIKASTNSDANVRFLETAGVEDIIRKAGYCSEESRHNVTSVPFVPVEKIENSMNTRRIQVLNVCLESIFENRLWEARKMMSAVELALRLVETRVYLCRQLSALAVPVTRATLQPQQFELIVRLLNCALEQESEDDEHGVAYACLHLCNLYCRRLTQGVHQFAYTCVQDHPVWSNHKFWECAFFHDVHELMRRNYGQVKVADTPLSGESLHDMWNLDEQPTAMQIAAENMQNQSSTTHNGIKRDKDELPEESIVFGQAKHYINLMVFLRIPLDPSRLRRVDKNDLELRGNSVGRVDMPSSASVDSDCESGYLENGNDGDIGASVVTWITRLIDRLCCAARLDSHMIERLINDIPGFVAVHIDNLEQVYAESRKLAPPPKSKLLTPILLTPCERLLMGGLRCVMLADTCTNRSDNPEFCTTFLPAEGAVYLTNYRVVFKGRPLNPFLNEKVIVRSIPIMSMVREKSINDSQLLSRGFMEGISAKVASGLHDAIQIRSSCFMLLRFAFDEDVSPDQVEEFSRTLSSLRWPVSLPQTFFAFVPVSHLLCGTLTPGTKSKLSTIREFKKTITKGLPIKGSLYKRTESRTFAAHRKSLTVNPGVNATLQNESDYLDLSEGRSESGTLARDLHRYTKDYERLRLKGENSLFRMSHANSYYDISKSYPSCFVVPCSISDAMFGKVAKGFKNGRLPVITWVSENGALLIRGAAFVSGNVLNKIKKQATLLHQTESSGNMGSQTTVASKESSEVGQNLTHTSLELQETYISRIALASPSAYGSGLLTNYKSESNTSLISLESLFTADGSSVCTGTPDMGRRNVSSDFMRASSNFARTSTGKSGARNRLSSIGSKQLQIPEKQAVYLKLQSVITNVNRKSLYVLVDKGHAKALRVDKHTELIPVSYPSSGQLKSCFKKLLRAVQPSDPASEQTSFLKQLDESEWMIFVSQLLALAVSVSCIITSYNSSVAFCIEDGSDATCVITSVVQILQDSYYRTFDGFKVLVEKEWLAFGHRFSHRANHTIGSQNSGIAPVFLLFLDIVHQILEQYPSAFEFNDFYLRFLAYHSQTAFFRTFLFDSEYERQNIERMAPDTSEGHRGCIWTYITQRSTCSPIFHNLTYKEDQNALLPGTSLATLDLWIFYCQNNYVHGSPYDIEMAESEIAEQEEESYANPEGVTRGEASAEVVDSRLLAECLRFHDGLAQLSQAQDCTLSPKSKNKSMWKKVWSEVVCEEDTGVVEPRYEQQVQKSMQKRLALKLILKGEIQRAAKKQSPLKAHAFEYYTSSGTQPRDCSVCHFALYGNVVRTGQRCKNCGIIVHDKCVVNITWPCGQPSDSRTKRAFESTPIRESSTEKSTLLENDKQNTTFETTLDTTKTLTGGRNRSAPLHQGYLQKKGAKFKLWTPRWFVLEPSIHKLSYFENESDSTCRGQIDLFELESVDVIHSGSKAILELRLANKTVSLMAEGKSDADSWKEKIENALRE